MLFGRAAGFGFLLFDDPLYVTDNPWVRGGLTREGVRWAWTSLGYAGNWHPLTWLSHMLDVEWFGLRPGAHHLVSVALHALSAASLFFALARLLRAAPAVRDDATWIAALVAAAFAVHPLRIESVVWISERKDVLATLFWNLGLLAYARYAERPGLGRYALVALALALGLLSKPTLVTFPLVLLLLDVWPLGRLAPRHGALVAGSLAWRRVREKLPLLALAVAVGVAVLVAQRTGDAISSLGAAPPGLRLANAVVAYGDYLRKLVWPVGLAVFYPFPLSGVPLGKALAAAGALVGLSGAALVTVRGAPWLFVGWTWYVVTLLPMIGLVHVGMHAGADRYTYVPHVGLLLSLGCALVALRRHAGRVGRRLIGGAAWLGVVGLAAVTWSELPHWRDDRTLFTRATEVTEGNFLAELGLALDSRDRGDFRRAVEHAAAAVRWNPHYAAARRELGSLLVQSGDAERALEHLARAVELGPADARNHTAQATALLAAGRASEAVEACERALQRDPRSYAARNQLGVAWAALGEPERAVAEYARATELRPDLFDAHLNLGVSLLRLGRHTDAVAALRTAVARRPDSAEARLALGVASHQAGDVAGAREQLARLDALDPERAAGLRRLLAEPPPGGADGADGTGAGEPSC